MQRCSNPHLSCVAPHKSTTTTTTPTTTTKMYHQLKTQENLVRYVSYEFTTHLGEITLNFTIFQLLLSL